MVIGSQGGIMKLSRLLLLAGLAFLGGMAVNFHVVSHDNAAPPKTPGRPAIAKIAVPTRSSPTAVPNAWNTSSSDEELLGLARIMIARSPEAALAWAQSCTEAGLRQRLHLAVARAWGERHPADAVNWALTQNEDNPSEVLKAVVIGAIRQPAAAVEIGRDLLAQKSPYAGTYGTDLVEALDADGQFMAAVQFAWEAPTDFREDWATAAAQAWAKSQPREALTALAALVDEPLRDPVFRAVVQGWPAGQPADLAAYALSLPAGEQRAYALDQVMFKWSRADPAGLAAWLTNVPSGPNYDTGAFFIVTEAKPALLGPETALTWVESIGDEGLRLNSFKYVLGQWGQTDPGAARNYVQQAGGLEAAERAKLLQSISPP